MLNPNQCPECGSLATKMQMRERYSDVIIEVRTCDNCPTEYEVNFGDPHIAEVRHYE